MSNNNATELQVAFESRQRAILDLAAQAYADGTRPVGSDFVRDFPMLAKANLTIPDDDFDRFCEQTKISKNADFSMVVLTRILALAPGQYDDRIKQVAESLPGFWMTYGDEQGVHWSENHFLMQSAIAMILNSHLGLDLPEGWRERVVFYLQEKIDIGYFEFNSQTYYGYSLAGLLNLYDFSDDAEIKDLARRASLRMLQDHINFSTESGQMRTTTGRATNLGVFIKERQNGKMDDTNALLGLGAPMPEDITSISKPSMGAMATTSLQVGELLARRTNHYDEVYTVGRTIEDFRARASQALSSYNDQITLSWTMGMYMNPETAYELVYNIDYYNLWNNHQFKSFQAFSWVTPGTVRVLSYLSNSFVGASILNTQVAAWRHNDAMLTSVQDYYRGLRGAQQFPWAAVAGPATVFTHASGDLDPDFGERSTRQTHLPSIKQSKNAALILYQPNSDLKMLDASSLPVSLHWPTSMFTEEATASGGWKLGRHNASYIAMYPACSELYQNEFIYCTDTRQAWAIVVGTEETHGSFENFTATVSAAQVEQLENSSCFGVRLAVDGQEIIIDDWCQEVGPATIFVALFLTYFMLAIIFSTVLCVRHRAFHSTAKSVDTVDDQVDAELADKKIAPEKKTLGSSLMLAILPTSRCKLGGLLCIYFSLLPLLVLGFAVGFFGEGTPATIAISAIGLIAFFSLHVGTVIYLKRRKQKQCEAGRADSLSSGDEP